MADLAQILRTLGETKGFQAAVLTTYNVSFRFFEHVVLPRLRGVGCQHVLLLVDAARLSEAANDPDSRPQLAGKLYSVVPIAVPGAFHPKLVLQLGKDAARVWVGSHNLTMAGFNHNREVTTAGSSRSEGWARAVAQQAWIGVKTWLPDDPVAAQAASAVERLAPWVTDTPEPSPDGLELLFSTATTPLWTQIGSRLPVNVDRVTLVGPFFDDRLELVHTVARDLAPREIVIGIVPEQAKFPSSRRHELPASVRVVHAHPLLPTGTPPYLHAKALLVEKGETAVLVTGSANPSAPAFLGGERANCEAVMVQHVRVGADPLGLHRLRDAPSLTEDDWSTLPLRIEADPARASAPCLLGIAEADEIRLPTAVAEVTAVRFLGESDVDLGTKPFPGWLAVVSPPESVPLDAIRWLDLLRDDLLVARVLVHHPRALKRLSRTAADQRLTEVLHSLETDQPAFAKLFDLLEPLLDEPIAARVVGRRAGDRAVKSVTHFGSGGADAQEAAARTEELYGTEGSLAEVMLFLHHRLGASESRVDRSEEELIDDDDERLVATMSAVRDVDGRELVRGRFDRTVKKLRKHLTFRTREEASASAHASIARLAAVLGVANATVRRTPPRPWQRLEHLRLASAVALRGLLTDGVAAAMFRLDLAKARAKVGERAEEVRMTPVLLAWLCCELRIAPPGPRRAGPLGSRTAELTDRAVWVALFPVLDEDHWARLLDTVLASDSSTEAQDWYDAARASAVHLKSVMNDPRAWLSNRERGEPGDLAWFGGDVLRVVQSDIGGPRQLRRVQWPEPGKPDATRTPENGRLLLPEAWAGA